MLETDDPELRERLVHRADDNEEAVKRRLEIYQVGACSHPHPGDPVSLRLFLPCPLVASPSLLYFLRNQVDNRFLSTAQDNIDGVMEFIDDLRQEFDGQRPMEELSREIISYIKPDAPLYALQSTLPAIRGADAVKEAFTKREEEHQEPPQPAEGEEAEAAPPADENAPPPLKGKEFREDIAKSIIDLALGKMFDERQEECRMRRLAYKFTAQHAIRTLDALVEVHFASHDTGDAYEEASWDAGTEPSSGAMDSWGRGVVPIRRKAKPLTLENVERGSDASRAGSARSVRSARSGRTFRGEGGVVPKPPAKKKAPAKKEDEKREVVQVELTPEEKLRLSLKAKLDEEGAKRKKEKEYAAEVLKFEKMAKSMASRGQNFTFDQKGEVIMVNELPGDKLPTPTVFTKAMPIGSQSGQVDQPFVQRMAEGLTMDPSKIFTPSDTVQPPAAESHSLASGVTLKEGTVTKQGIPRDKDPLRMSRKDYTLLAEEEALMMGGTMRKAQVRKVPFCHPQMQATVKIISFCFPHGLFSDVVEWYISGGPGRHRRDNGRNDDERRRRLWSTTHTGHGCGRHRGRGSRFRNWDARDWRRSNSRRWERHRWCWRRRWHDGGDGCSSRRDGRGACWGRGPGPGCPSVRLGPERLEGVCSSSFPLPRDPLCLLSLLSQSFLLFSSPKSYASV